MNDFEKISGPGFFLIRLIFLFVVLFNSSIYGQQVLEPTETINPTLPLKLCLQRLNKKIEPLNIASDNQSSIFIAFRGGRIEKINLDGNFGTWVSELGGEIASDLIFEDKRVFLITKVPLIYSAKENDESQQTINYVLWSLDAETGVTIWRLPFTAKSSVLLKSFQDKIFLTEKDGGVTSIRKSDAQIIWKENFGQEISSPPDLNKNKIYISTGDNSILTVSADNGVIVSKLSKLKSPASILIADENNLYWGDRKGFVTRADTSTKSRIWNVRYGGEISSLTITRNGVLVTSLDNFVYLISMQKGKKIWKRRLAGRILVRPLIAHGFVVFVTAADNNAVILDLRNGRIINQISLADTSFILSAPLVIRNLLVFSTSKGIFAFAGINANCPDR